MTSKEQHTEAEVTVNTINTNDRITGDSSSRPSHEHIRAESVTPEQELSATPEIAGERKSDHDISKRSETPPKSPRSPPDGDENPDEFEQCLPIKSKADTSTTIEDLTGRNEILNTPSQHEINADVKIDKVETTCVKSVDDSAASPNTVMEEAESIINTEDFSEPDSLNKSELLTGNKVDISKNQEILTLESYESIAPKTHHGLPDVVTEAEPKDIKSLLDENDPQNSKSRSDMDNTEHSSTTPVKDSAPEYGVTNISKNPDELQKSTISYKNSVIDDNTPKQTIENNLLQTSVNKSLNSFNLSNEVNEPLYTNKSEKILPENESNKTLEDYNGFKDEPSSQLSKADNNHTVIKGDHSMLNGNLNLHSGSGSEKKNEMIQNKQQVTLRHKNLAASKNCQQERPDSSLPFKGNLINRRQSLVDVIELGRKDSSNKFKGLQLPSKRNSLGSLNIPSTQLPTLPNTITAGKLPSLSSSLNKKDFRPLNFRPLTRPLSPIKMPTSTLARPFGMSRITIETPVDEISSPEEKDKSDVEKSTNDKNSPIEKPYFVRSSSFEKRNKPPAVLPKPLRHSFSSHQFGKNDETKIGLCSDTKDVNQASLCNIRDVNASLITSDLANEEQNKCSGLLVFPPIDNSLSKDSSPTLESSVKQYIEEVIENAKCKYKLEVNNKLKEDCKVSTLRSSNNDNIENYTEKFESSQSLENTELHMDNDPVTNPKSENNKTSTPKPFVNRVFSSSDSLSESENFEQKTGAKNSLINTLSNNSSLLKDFDSSSREDLFSEGRGSMISSPDAVHVSSPTLSETDSGIFSSKGENIKTIVPILTENEIIDKAPQVLSHNKSSNNSSSFDLQMRPATKDALNHLVNADQSSNKQQKQDLSVSSTAQILDPKTSSKYGWREGGKIGLSKYSSLLVNEKQSDHCKTETITVEFEKGAVGLGFCIEGGKGSPVGDRPITVKRLFKGTTSANGLLRAGDQILRANDHDFSDVSHFTAWNYLKTLPEGAVSLVIKRAITENS